MSETRRFWAIVVLFLMGFGMVVLADALDAWWPLFVTPFIYAVIPWMIVRHEREAAAAAVRPEAPSEG